MKGIILAGGKATRLFPATLVVSKQLLSVYDKPMVYYPLSVLMLAGIREVLLISTPEDLPMFQRLFGDGSQLGMEISYRIQEKPNGLAEAFILGEDFIANDDVCLILGDNIFYGVHFSGLLKEAAIQIDGAKIFGYYVVDPREYGVVEFDENYNVLSLEEKPDNPKSKYVIPGLYFYDKTVVQRAKNLKPSPRGELEITDLNLSYLNDKKLKVTLLGRGFAWLDTGNPSALLEASNFIAAIQHRQGQYIACIEEIAYRNKWISKAELFQLSEKFSTKYSNYLREIAEEG